MNQIIKNFLRNLLVVFAVFGIGVSILLVLKIVGFEEAMLELCRIIVYLIPFGFIWALVDLGMDIFKFVIKPRCIFPEDAEDAEDAEDTEVRFLVAKDKADKMTLEQLVELSEDFNVGYDIPEGMFEVMLKIPIEDLEK